MDGWERILTGALLGAERSPLPAELPDFPLELTGDKAEERLLGAAAAAAVYRRAGFVAPTIANVIADLAPEERAPLHRGPVPDAVEQLYEMGFLQECLEIIAERSERLPHLSLPALLDVAVRRKNDVELRAVVRRVMGERGRWLAERNKRWRPMLEAETDSPPAPEPQAMRQAEEDAVAALRSDAQFFSADVMQPLAQCRHPWSGTLADALWKRLEHEAQTQTYLYSIQSLYPLLRYLPVEQLHQWITGLYRLVQEGKSGLDNLIYRLETRRQFLQETLHAQPHTR